MLHKFKFNTVISIVYIFIYTLEYYISALKSDDKLLLLLLLLLYINDI